MILIKRYRRRKKSLGATLIELMTAIFIISVMASIVAPVYRRSIDKSKFNVCTQNLKNIVTGITTFHLENKKYPDRLSDLLPKGYLNSLPQCPSAGMDTYSAGYQFDAVTGDFTIICKGTYHASLGYGQDEPYYIFSKGMGP